MVSILSTESIGAAGRTCLLFVFLLCVLESSACRVRKVWVESVVQEMQVSYKQKMPKGMLFDPTEEATKFRVFTLHAGLQHAAFQFARCRRCKCCFLGGWTFIVRRGGFGKCMWMGPMPEDFFVMPRQQSWMGVDTALLGFVSAQLLHAGGGFSTVLRVWADLHRDDAQPRLILGENSQLERNQAQRLEDTWLIQRAVHLAGGADREIEWNFQDLDATFTKYDEILRTQHFGRVLLHLPECPRCRQGIILVTDGKRGARRRVCANMDQFLEWPELKVALQTGCIEYADSRNVHCKRCRRRDIPAAEVRSSVAAASVTQGQVRVLGTQVRMCPPDRVRLCYVVECVDGKKVLVERADVEQRLLLAFEKEQVVRRPAVSIFVVVRFQGSLV